VLPSLGHEQSGTLSRVIREALGPDATIHVLDYHGNPAEEATCLGRIVPEGFTSAIVYPSMRGESIRLVLKLLVEDFPLVFLDRAFTEVPACSALADNRTGGYLATKHLLSKGCRRIACFTDDLPTSYQRLRGYRDALGEAAVPFDTRLIVKIPDEEEAEHEGTRRFLEEGDPPDGIFYSNDYHAIAGMQQIKAAGLRIPEDVRVIGFDDLSLARFAEPALTTIRQDHEQLGREAARLLVEQVERNPGERFAMRKTIIPVELVERDSA
jgi:DNA-binding LacI/PurR family transcriptional regulator